MAQAFIGLGSNLQQPAEQLRRALAALRTLPGTQLGAISSFYGNPAIGPGEQPDYVNAVAELHTTLEPMALLRRLQAIELAHGRVRTERWGARTLDLDLLLYDQQVIDEPDLTVPHPRLTERDFVLVPLAEIAPDLRLPDGSAVTDYRERTRSTLVKIGSFCPAD
ncbi:MAG: 2-amino-4-hydroxy-6-hydroxymethyldihydropteridine diphosphokinase [Spongiibacteraceae bacterium]|jgi:2-amino-4-hydroxy-6-hydroxymethyldihydropteridine diphosphokinase|nr:2-amino-4-hydroxy-6-hydroxymethyldihydropteridine diphosphokinase [Spongiibacteraceae bacterium]